MNEQNRIQELIDQLLERVNQGNHKNFSEAEDLGEEMVRLKIRASSRYIILNFGKIYQK